MIQARPTEYRRIRFRSKSEAVLARALDLANKKWKYEVLFCGHEWDFQLLGNPTIFLEYKPRLPTRTYLEELERKVCAWWVANDDARARFFVIHGSPWEPSPLTGSYSLYPLLPVYTDYDLPMVMIGL